LTGIAAKKAKLEPSSVLYKKITRKDVGMIIQDFQPYSFVEDKGFKDLMQHLEPRYELAIEQHFRDTLFHRFMKK